MYSEKHCQRSEKVRGGVCSCTDALRVCCNFENIHSGLLESLRPAVLNFLSAVATPTELRSSPCSEEGMEARQSSHGRQLLLKMSSAAFLPLGKKKRTVSSGDSPLDWLLSVQFDCAYDLVNSAISSVWCLLHSILFDCVMKWSLCKKKWWPNLNTTF